MKKWFLLFLKVGSVSCTFGLAILIAFGLFFPWQVAEEALPQLRTSHKLLVGIGYEGHFSGDRSSERRTQTYVILPSVLETWATIEVTKDDGGVRTEVHPYGALAVLVAFILGLFGLWYFFVLSRLHEK